MKTLANPQNERRAVIARIGVFGAFGATLLAGPALVQAAGDKPKKEEDSTYDQDSIFKAATEFFGDTTEGLAKVIEKAFKEQGRPNAYIKGEEAGGALTVGLRYGQGHLVTKAGASSPVFWSSPSIGFDAGGNASKVFTLIYKLPRASAIYQRFPAVDGSLYYIGGAGINYQRRNGITLAPIRLGVGLRAGASVGYVHYRREKSLNPF